MQAGTQLIRCVVGDDHEVLRLGLVRALGAPDDIEVVGQAGDGDAARALIERRRPDVAVLDLHMPRLGTLELCAELAGSGTRVLVYTGDADPAALDGALDAGAAGYVVKTGPLSELVRAVRVVAAGSTYVEATLASELLARRAQAAPSVLSGREGEVLQRLADGMTTEQTAQDLFLSPGTVRSYAETAMQKLASRNRTHAVATALREGLIR